MIILNKALGLISAIVLLFITVVAGFYAIFQVNQLAILPIEDCRSSFIFTPESVEYCSDIYLVDEMLIAFRFPVTYVALAAVIGLVVLVVKFFHAPKD
ncbi:hypothetical protein ABID56_001363 [Alkalibacillus flavidus]|uniref:DUF4321 domain-containing protein n=1 Tax=Alkalibacillus flavidus TaxID=546021 RepID=A0ABV2KUL7_9BACI